MRAQILASHTDDGVAFDFPQGQRGGLIIEFAGSMSHVCSPSVVCFEGDDRETRNWRLLTLTMNDYLHAKWTMSELKVTRTSLPKIKKDFEPFFFFKYTSLETLAVVAEGTQPSSDPSGLFGPSAGAGGSSTSTRVKCEVCGESWDKSKIQQHIGAHMLQEHWKQWPSKKRPRYPCGLCGLRGAFGVDQKKPKMRKCQVVICG